MKTLLAFIALIPLGFSSFSAEAPERELRTEKATQVASAWFDSLTRGNTAVTTALSDVPFAFDRKQTIESINELEALLESIVESKGKRDIEILGVSVIHDGSEILNKTFPASYIVVFLQTEGDGGGVKLCVKPGDTYKVVGFSD